MEDFDELIASLTPRQRTDPLRVYQNTVAIACPACEEPFDDLVICDDEFTSINLDGLFDLCVTTHDENAILFTHKQ